MFLFSSTPAVCFWMCQHFGESFDFYVIYFGGIILIIWSRWPNGANGSQLKMADLYTVTEDLPKVQSSPIIKRAWFGLGCLGLFYSLSLFSRIKWHEAIPLSETPEGQKPLQEQLFLYCRNLCQITSWAQPPSF